MRTREREAATLGGVASAPAFVMPQLKTPTVSLQGSCSAFTMLVRAKEAMHIAVSCDLDAGVSSAEVAGGNCEGMYC